MGSKQFSLVNIFNIVPQLRITVWSLVSGTATYMQYPVHPDRGTLSAPCSIHFDHHKHMLLDPMVDILFSQNATNPKTQSVSMMQKIRTSSFV